jgi:hypothetical protein
MESLGRFLKSKALAADALDMCHLFVHTDILFIIVFGYVINAKPFTRKVGLTFIESIHLFLH